VLEPSVHRTWVNKVGPSELPDPPQSLKRRLLDNIPLPVVNLNEAVDWAANFVFAMGVFRQPLNPPLDPIPF
jgi:hypothetical protein